MRRLLPSLALSLFALNAHSAPPSQNAPGQPAAMQATLLQGKLTFNLPEGFNARELPAGRTEEGTAGASGNIYANPQTRQIVVVAEAPVSDDATDDDKRFLSHAAQGYVRQQKQAAPDYRVTKEETIQIKGMNVHRIDATGTFAGSLSQNTSFLTRSGPRLGVVQVVSRESDAQGHADLVQRVLRGSR
ncbi:hypothetical protein ACLQ9F_13310 [Bordetella avium]|uniref:Exported protein n=1 Tax=Bordetella avium (strain 197N) TaxID=360910 RepID=Q2KWU3_BORA1|nr:hypothetical protein [Bordetella avium]AZY49954.1 hypothetical protein C0J09_13080 [Bordetella avium]AZY53322.1 hypothetical protein C0J07_13190 [Bordetella avium]RIQ17311.1 hypothetical protein D0850_10560 [Bordetella avium]RIQ33796.1 hypothetical protein D0849_09320 [Bordetella avium]RIQ51988.1 hypothetical protein D0843_08895 [Bordetella avium]